MKNFGRRKVRNNLGGRRIPAAPSTQQLPVFSVDENQKIAVPTVNAESETALVS
jgi:hypothetical protein